MIVAIVAFILCISFGSSAHNKYTNYKESYRWGYDSPNHYVDEDEYNYIINGTYFTAFSILCGCSGIAGIIALCFGGYMYFKGKSEDGYDTAFRFGTEKLYDEKTGMWNT